MRHLLDSHTLLSLINDPANDILVSPASYWEIAIKVGVGKLDLHASYDNFMHRGIVGNDFEIVHVEPRHTSILTALPLQPSDCAGVSRGHSDPQLRRAV